MVAYGIDYKIIGKPEHYSVNIDARDLNSAKKKIGKKHGYKTGRMVKLERVSVIGYY